MSELVEKVAIAIWQARELTIPERTRMAWEKSSFAARRVRLAEAQAAIATTLDEIERHLSAVQYDPAPYTALKHRLAHLRREALG